MATEKQKIIYIITRAGDEPELAVTPFSLANVALAKDAEVIVLLMGYAVMLAMKGYAKTVIAPERPALPDLIEAFLEEEGKLLVCTPCCKGRELEASDLIEGAELVTAIRVTEEILTAKAVIAL